MSKKDSFLKAPTWLNHNKYLRFRTYHVLRRVAKQNFQRGPKKGPNIGTTWTQNRQKRHPETISKNNKKYVPNEPKLVPKWGPKMEPKSSEMMSWGHLCTRVAPKLPPDLLRDRFWTGVGLIVGPFLTDFPTQLG